MFSVGSPCQTVCQVFPASSECQTPPPGCPRPQPLGRSAASGWTTAQVIRPPMLAGPTAPHAPMPGTGGTSAAIRARSRSTWSIGDSRNGHASRAWSQALRALCVLPEWAEASAHSSLRAGDGLRVSCPCTSSPLSSPALTRASAARIVGIVSRLLGPLGRRQPATIGIPHDPGIPHAGRAVSQIP